jgi:hypothetical protein
MITLLAEDKYKGCAKEGPRRGEKRGKAIFIV